MGLYRNPGSATVYKPKEVTYLFRHISFPSITTARLTRLGRLDVR